MPLTLEELQGIQADAMADDLEIDFEKMSLWTAEQATAYFESGGEEVPGAAPPAPAKAAPMPKPSEDTLKLWFPFQARSGFVAKPKFRIVCFHNAGSSESVYTGKGMRQTSENPFVVHCKENGGELLAVQLPGRDARRTEPRHRKIQPYAEQIFPILAPLLQDEAVPYVVVSHSMGTWMAYEFLKLVAEKGIPYPKQLVVSGFPAPSWPEADRPWNKNAPMADPAFMDECRGWNVNEIVFQEGNWKTFKDMMRDDFTLFDEYEYSPPPAFLPKGEFPFPIKAKVLKDDQRAKKKHLEAWQAFTSEKLAFEVTEFEGNHLFFYQYPERAKWMEQIVKGLPAGFGSVELS